MKYEISEMGNFFRIEIIQTTTKDLKKSEGLPEKLPEKLSEKLPELQKAIVLRMHSDPEVT